MLTSGAVGHLTRVVEDRQVVWDYNRVWLREALRQLDLVEELQDYVLKIIPPLKVYNVADNITAIAQLQDTIVVSTANSVQMLNLPHEMRCTGPVHCLQLSQGIVAHQKAQNVIVAVSGGFSQSYLLSVPSLLPVNLVYAHKVLVTRLNVAILHAPGGMFEWPGVTTRAGVLDFALMGTGVVILEHRRLIYLPFYLDQLGWERDLQYDSKVVRGCRRFAATEHEVFGLGGKCYARSPDKPFVYVDDYTAYWNADEGLLL